MSAPAFLLSFLLAVPAAAHELAVLSALPAGPAQTPEPPDAVIVVFNQPMVALASPSDMGRSCPLKLSPAVKGRCRWRGSSVLAFEPEAPLPPASLWKAELPSGTRSEVTGEALKEARRWTFETRRPNLLDSRPRDGDRWIAGGATLFLRFDLDMDPRRARESLSLEETALDGAARRTVALGVRRATPEELKEAWPYWWGASLSTHNVLALKPAEPLRRERAYRLVAAPGLRAARGELGSASERSVRFETYRRFALAEGPGPACLPRAYRVSFTNPVRYGDLLEHLRVEGSTAPWAARPSARELEDAGAQDAQSRVVRFSLDGLSLPLDGRFALVVDGGLRDLEGQALGQDARVEFVNDGLCPRLSMPTGFGVLEAGLPPRHPVTAVNTGTVPARKLRVPDEVFVPFWRGVQWGCHAPFALEGDAAAWDLKLPRNRSLRTFADMGAALPGGGLAALEVQANGCYHKAVVDVTRLGLHFKTSPDSTLVWATYLKTGLPAAGVPVTLRGDDNAVLWRGVTGKNGVADAPGWSRLGIKDWKRWSRPNLWAFAHDAKGTAVLSLDWHGELQPWRFSLLSDWAPRPRRYGASFFTERGVYRAGETVRFKGILRKLEDGDWKALGAGDPKELLLTVTDSRGAEVARATVPVSAQSSLDAAVALRAGAATGHWTARLRERDGGRPLVSVAGEEGEGGPAPSEDEDQLQASAGFRVEAFKPAVFEVKAVASSSSYVAGEDYAAAIEGWYLFGAPMAGEKASWTLRLEPWAWTPPGWEGWSFRPPWEARRAETGRLLGSGDLELDGQGRAAVTARLEPGDATGALGAVLEASVTSPERQKLFGRSSAVVHRADLYLALRSTQTFVETGERWSAQAVPVRPGGARAPREAAWTLTRREWYSIQRAGVAGRLEWVSGERTVTVASGAFASSPSTWTWSYVPDKPGLYIWKVAAADEAGRPAASALDLHVAGAGDAWWKRSDSDLIELVPDQTGYKPGQTARLLVKSPYERAVALVTVEREGVLARWTQPLLGGASVVRVPLDDRAAPNVFVSVTVVRGRVGKQEYDEDGQDLAKPQAKFGYVMLPVDPGGRRLSVGVETDKAEYRPGAPVSAKVALRGADGRPAAGEVTLFAVDEGVLSLTGYRTPDPFDDFYGQRPLLVGSADSRPFVIGQRSFGEKGKARGGGGGRGMAPPGADLRQDFRPTAYWGPTLAVGPTGVATATFTLPDSLTRFRVMAVAHAGRRFGAGESRLAVSKPLSLRPSLPRLARVGDAFEGGAVVHNFTREGATVAVTLGLEGTVLAFEGAPAREVFVPAGRAVEVSWLMRATGLGEAALRFTAKSGGGADGLLWKVPVRATERLERAATSGVADGRAAEAVTRPTNAMPGGTLEASFSASAMAGLGEGARYLLEYPYGCLEQRLSRVMPVVTGADLVATFGLGTLGGLKGAAQKELERLPDFQHASGGYGYWTTFMMPDPWLTAYALETAALAKKEGYAVPEDSLARAAAWLKGWLASEKRDWAYPYSDSEEYASRAYAAYALGLRGDPQPAAFQRLYERRDQLPYLAKAYLLKAARGAAGAAEASALRDELLSQARVAPRTLHFEDERDAGMRWLHGSSARTTAVVLQALLEAEGGFPGDEKAARWLVEERKAKGRWRTTIENSASLRALQDFYRRYEKEEPDFEARWGREGEGSALWTQRFKGRALERRAKALPLDEVLGSGKQARLEFVKQGAGRLYYDLVLAYAPASFEKPAFEGFEVERRLDPLRGETLKAGGRAMVTLTVRTKMDRTFVALEDALPAGWEIVDTSFATESREDASALADEGERGWHWGSFQRAEKYDDRIQVFADYLTAGTHRWTYLVQATTPGRYHVPAAVVEQMYEPEVFGRTASSETEVRR